MHFLRILNAIPPVCLIFLSFFINAQEISITGKVTSEAGPLAGVNVMIQGTTYGNITDTDGNYTLVIPDRDGTLIFSYVGYKTVTEFIGDKSIINVTMDLETSQLEELIVTGYSTQSRRNISGAISIVDPDEIASIPANSVTKQLQGRAAGVIVTGSGLPGGDVGVRIRGYGTISEYMSEPLYIVDGIPIESTYIENLNPMDVESIQILKEASTASIYGARAANGVIIITTKSGGSSEGPELAFDSYFGVQHFTNSLEFVTPEEIAMLTEAGKQNADLPLQHPQYSLTDGTWGLPDYIMPAGHSIALDGPVDENSYDLETNPITLTNREGTDWFDEITEPAIVQNYNLIVSGGNSKGKYAVSMGFFDHNGIVKHTGLSKWMARVNTVFNIKDKLRIGESIGLTYQVKKNAFQDVSHPAIGQSFTHPGIKPVYDILGNFTGDKYLGIGGVSNPVGMLERGKDNHEKRYNFMGAFFIEWDILNELTFKTSFNPMLDLTYESKIFEPSVPQDQVNVIATLSQDSRNMLNWTWYNTLTYAKTFGSRHNFQALLGTESIDNQITYFGSKNQGYYLQDINYQHLDAGEKIVENSGISREWSLFSMFAKLDYNYDGKYITSATIRRDGSSRFGQNNRYALFPAFSLAWRLSGERFMQNAGSINDLKMRAGWGQAGNQNIGDYIIYDTFRKDIQTAGYDIYGTQNTAVVGFRPDLYGNPNAKWETSTTLNLGMDIAMFNNQFTASIDLYKRLTTDMLIQVEQPALSGNAAPPGEWVTRIWQNIGEMENKGIDIALNYQNNRSRDFNWGAGINFTHYENNVSKLSYGGEQLFNGVWTGDGFSHIITEDQPIGTFYGYQIHGIFQSMEEVVNGPVHDVTWLDDPTKGIGRWQFLDTNRNDTISIDDKTYIGSPHPDFTCGIPLNFSYKGFALNFFFYGSYGNEIYNVNRFGTDIWYEGAGKKSKRVLEAWGLPGVNNQLAILPQINDRAPEREKWNSSYMVEDGSYLRLNQLIFAYNFKTSSWRGIERLRIYFQGDNLFTWTNYQGLDPNIFSRDYILGMDSGYYPNSKTYLIGLNVSFK